MRRTEKGKEQTTEKEEIHRTVTMMKGCRSEDLGRVFKDGYLDRLEEKGTVLP